MLHYQNKQPFQAKSDVAKSSPQPTPVLDEVAQAAQATTPKEPTEKPTTLWSMIVRSQPPTTTQTQTTTSPSKAEASGKTPEKTRTEQEKAEPAEEAPWAVPVKYKKCLNNKRKGNPNVRQTQNTENARSNAKEEPMCQTGKKPNPTSSSQVHSKLPSSISMTSESVTILSQAAKVEVTPQSNTEHFMLIHNYFFEMLNILCLISSS